MIYTITFNPALDYITQVENFKIGKINRTKAEKILPGGKGLNVSIVLNNLKIKNTAIAFIGGFTGEELKNKIENYGIGTDFIKVTDGITRINIKINSDEETAINGQGPQIMEKEIKELLEKIDKMKNNDIVVISGNIPNGVPKTIYETICEKLAKKEILYIVDATRELLINVLKYKPFLIKPNKEEIEETFNVKLNNIEEIKTYARKLQEMGAQNVLVSLGGEGALLISKDKKEYYSKAPKGKVINTVGAGDSMVAGFLTGFLKTNKYENAFKMGIATGSASAFSENLATEEDVEKILHQM